MRHPLRIIVVISVLALSVLGASCGSLPSSASDTPYPGPEATLEQALALSTPLPANSYPGPEPTPTVYPPPPRSTRTPTLEPSATPLPTALPLPPAAFYALWAENIPSASPDKSKGVIWLADPGDIANRQEVAHLDEGISKGTLSPNGQRLAVITRHQPQGGNPVWVVNLDGTDLRQVASDAWQVLWGPSDQTLFYTLWKGGTTTIERVDLGSGESQPILALDAPDIVQLLGWSQDGKRLYYFYQSSESKYEVWAVEPNGRNPQVQVTLGTDPGVPVLSPDSSGFLAGTPEGLSWVSIDGTERQVIAPRGQFGRGFSAIWSPDGREVVVSQWQTGWKQVTIQAIDRQSRLVRSLGKIPADDWRLLTLSPDGEWLAVYRYYESLYWVHLPTLTMVSLGGQDRLAEFISWIPRGTGR